MAGTRWTAVITAPNQVLAECSTANVGNSAVIKASVIVAADNNMAATRWAAVITAPNQVLAECSTANVGNNAVIRAQVIVVADIIKAATQWTVVITDPNQMLAECSTENVGDIMTAEEPIADHAAKIVTQIFAGLVSAAWT